MGFFCYSALRKNPFFLVKQKNGIHKRNDSRCKNDKFVLIVSVKVFKDKF